jgi:hypothetical protein
MLQVLEDARAHTISLAMTMGLVFWPFKWFDKLDLRLFITTWFCLNVFTSYKYSKTFLNK